MNRRSLKKLMQCKHTMCFSSLCLARYHERVMFDPYRKIQHLLLPCLFLLLLFLCVCVCVFLLLFLFVFFWFREFISTFPISHSADQAMFSTRTLSRQAVRFAVALQHVDQVLCSSWKQEALLVFPIPFRGIHVMPFFQGH